jgi:hypothetical protein
MATDIFYGFTDYFGYWQKFIHQFIVSFIIDWVKVVNFKIIFFENLYFINFTNYYLFIIENYFN